MKESGKNHSSRKIRDKRAHPRIPVPFVKVRFEGCADDHSCVILNLSRSGALVQTPRSLSRNTLVGTSFVLPGVDGPLECGARVVWSRDVYDVHARMGIRFEGDDALLDKLGDFVSSQIVSRAEIEARVAPRSPAPFVAVMVDAGSERIQGAILDISRVGILVQTARPVNSDGILGVAFILPETHGVVKCQAKVVWRRDLYDGHFTQGMEFIGIASSVLKDIDGFVRKSDEAQALKQMMAFK